MKRWAKVLSIITCLTVLVALCVQMALPVIAKSLVYENYPEKTPVDMIVVLSGGGGSRVKKAVQHYHQGVSDTLLFTGEPFFLSSIPQLMAEYAVARGVKRSDILLEQRSLSTRDNAERTIEIIKKEKATSVLIVTSLFHTRRSYACFKKEFSKKLPNVTLYISGSKDGVDYDTWYKHHESIQTIGFELIKTLYYRLFIL